MIQTRLDNVLRDVVVLDTSAILYDAGCLFSFRDNDVVIPLPVLDEVDKFRSMDSELGRNARSFVRSLNNLRKRGELSKGVSLLEETGSILRVEYVDSKSCPNALDWSKCDNKILGCCLDIKIREAENINVTLITKDISLTVKASALGIDCEDYFEDRPVNDTSQLYSGVVSISVPSKLIDKMYSYGFLSASSLPEKYGNIQFYENCGVKITSTDNSNQSSLATYANGSLLPLSKDLRVISGVESKNMEQSFAMNLLSCPEVKLVTLTGHAGTGKTLLAIAYGISSLDDKTFDRLVISRPIQPLGKDIGYLPGDIHEKTDPWMGPIRDAVEYVFGGDRRKYDDMRNMDMLEIEPLTYIRGRSMPRTLFILDEAQNITKHEMKTIITRIGVGSKIILTGDVLQIDNHYLDTITNGLTYVIEKFKGSALAGHVTLVKGQRSPLASLAAEIL